MSFSTVFANVNRYVDVVHYGPHQWSVLVYDKAARAWRTGNMVRREQALRAVWEAKAGMALELLDVEGANALASQGVYNDYPQDWRTWVRDTYRRMNQSVR
jgi:hypothetical protein